MYLLEPIKNGPKIVNNCSEPFMKSIFTVNGILRFRKKTLLSRSSAKGSSSNRSPSNTVKSLRTKHPRPESKKEYHIRQTQDIPTSSHKNENIEFKKNTPQLQQQQQQHQDWSSSKERMQPATRLQQQQPGSEGKAPARPTQPRVQRTRAHLALRSLWRALFRLQRIFSPPPAASSLHYTTAQGSAARSWRSFCARTRESLRIV